MKADFEDLSGVEKKITVEIEAEQVQKKLDAAYRDLKKQANVKGFRPGKVPRSVLERRYGEKVQADLAAQLVNESLSEAVQQEKLAVLNIPRITPPQIHPDQAYRYEITLEVRPEIGEIEFKDLALKKHRYQIDQKTIDIQLEALQKRMATQESIPDTRPLQEGDYALITYTGYENGEVCEETALTKNYAMKIGDGYISNELDKALVGMEKMETRKAPVQFPEDYVNPKLSGKTIEFEVTLTDIQQEVLPEIDDAFATQMGNFENLAQLREAITKNLTDAYAKRTEQEMNEQVFQALIAKTDFDLPPSMVQAQTKALVNEALQAFEQGNKTLEAAGMSEEDLDRKCQPIAEKEVRRQFILAQIVAQEDLKLAPDELKTTYGEIAGAYRQPVEQIEAFYRENPDSLEGIRHTLLEKKALALIIENAQIEEIELTADEDNDTQAG